MRLCAACSTTLGIRRINFPAPLAWRMSGCAGRFDATAVSLDVQLSPNPAQNPSLKEAASKFKEAEQKLRDNPSVKENLAKLREAEKKLRDNPSVKENLSKLKDAEQKLKEDAKTKQVRVCRRMVDDVSPHTRATFFAFDFSCEESNRARDRNAL